MTEAPPALVNPPQFTAGYWRKVPRQRMLAQIARVTNREHAGEAFLEIVLDNGMAFQRKRAEISQLLTANLKVEVESLNNEIVTGLFVPSVGWAFRMSAEDLAEYTKALTAALYQRKQAQRQAMVEHLCIPMGAALQTLGVTFQDEMQKRKAALMLATTAVKSLEQAGETTDS